MKNILEYKIALQCKDMDLQELCYFTHVKNSLDKKEAAQIKIRRWYHFLKLKSSLRLYVYSGAYNLRLLYRYNVQEVEGGSFILFKSNDNSSEIVFNNNREKREYFMRMVLHATTCYYIENDGYDNILLVLS
jgi:hypothetical protein